MGKLTSRDFHRPEQKEFYKVLEAISPSGAQPFYKLFEDFLFFATATFRQGVHKLRTGRIDEQLERDYLERIRRYDREKAEGFPAALAILVNALEIELYDFLGDVAQASGATNHWAGQYFTPQPLCEAMARMQMSELDPKTLDHRLTVCEPACGGGAMLLAVAHELREQKFQPWHWWFEAKDIDHRCTMMAYLQLALAGAPGVVRTGDTLRDTCSAAWLTPTGAMFFYHDFYRRDPQGPIALPDVPHTGPQMEFDYTRKAA